MTRPEDVNRVGRMMGGFGHQLVEHWPLIASEPVLSALANDVVRIVEHQQLGADIAPALAYLENHLARLPQLDGGAGNAVTP